MIAVNAATTIATEAKSIEYVRPSRITALPMVDLEVQGSILNIEPVLGFGAEL